MQRSWIVAVAAAAAILVAVVLLMRRGGPASDAGAGAVTLAERVYQNDSLGVRLRIPETGWALQRAEPNPDGRLVTASHEGGKASVELMALPATAETTVDGVLAARQRQVASAFGVASIDNVVARVIHDQQREVGGRSYRQWQAVSNPVEVPGDEKARVAFMWLVTATPRRSIECLGLVRYPATPDATAQQTTDALLRDVSYILQSFEVR